MDQKWVLKSKTIIGAILMMVPVICSLAGIEPPSAEELSSANVDFGQLMMGLSGLVGFGLTIYGRITAKHQLTVTGAPKVDSTTLRAVLMLFMLGGLATSLAACASAVTKVDDTLASDDVQTALALSCAVYHGVEAGWDIYIADHHVGEDALKAVTAAKAAVGSICMPPYPTSTNDLVATVVKAGAEVMRALKDAQAPPATADAGGQLAAGG
jgi:hypothetical protein